MVTEHDLIADIPELRRVVDELNKFAELNVFRAYTTDDGWTVAFMLDRTTNGWYVLEFLAWIINRDAALCGEQTIFYPTSPAPFLNDPGRSLCFMLNDPDITNAIPLADLIARARDEHYMDEIAAHSWDDEPTDPHRGASRSSLSGTSSA